MGSSGCPIPASFAGVGPGWVPIPASVAGVGFDRIDRRKTPAPAKPARVGRPIIGIGEICLTRSYLLL